MIEHDYRTSPTTFYVSREYASPFRWCVRAGWRFGSYLIAFYWRRSRAERVALNLNRFAQEHMLVKPVPDPVPILVIDIPTSNIAAQNRYPLNLKAWRIQRRNLANMTDSRLRVLQYWWKELAPKGSDVVVAHWARENMPEILAEIEHLQEKIRMLIFTMCLTKPIREALGRCESEPTKVVELLDSVRKSLENYS